MFLISAELTPSTEVPTAFSKYLLNKPTHEAGYDSYLTAVALIKMSARTDPSNILRVFPSSLSNKDPKSTRSSASLSISSLEEGGVLLDPDPKLDDPSSHNVFDVLASVSLQDTPESPSSDTQPTMRTMIPGAESSFWINHGNKLRVNGTQEEVFHIS